VTDSLKGFDDVSFVEHFDVVLANRYFAAVDADAAGSRWIPYGGPYSIFAQTEESKAVQFVVAGMNSHINQDWPLATVDACVTAGTRPLAGAIPADYQKINEVLEDIESETRLSLLNNLDQELDEPVEPLARREEVLRVAG
jgi:hypothetical protein